MDILINAIYLYISFRLWKKNIIFTLKCIWKAGGKKNVLENKSILLFVSLLPFFQSVTGISFAYLQLSNRYCRTGTVGSYLLPVSKNTGNCYFPDFALFLGEREQ